MGAFHRGSFWALLYPLPVARGESTGEFRSRRFLHGASRAEFETFIPARLVSCAMRFFHCQEKMDVTNGSVELFLKLLALGNFPTDQPCGARSENCGENRACADDD